MTWSLFEKKHRWRGSYLAHSQHVGDGFAADVGSNDDVVLAATVSSGHSFSRSQSDRLGHADQFFRCGFGARHFRGIEGLSIHKTEKVKLRALVCYEKRTYSDFLGDGFNSGFQRSRSASVFVFDSLDCLQERGNIGYHYLGKREQEKMYHLYKVPVSSTRKELRK
jgi:hypothetical protein